MSQQDRFDRAIQALHEAALTDVHWAEAAAAMDTACGWMGSSLAVVDVHDRARPEWLFVQSSHLELGESADEVAQDYFRDFHPDDEALPRHVALPDRRLVHVTDLLTAESQIAAALAEGGTVRDIAAATCRAETTVRWLVRQIHMKLGISRQADLVRLVLSAHALPERRP